MYGSRPCDLRAPIWLAPEWKNVSSCGAKGSRQLDEDGTFTLAWLPPFVPIGVVPVALKNLHRALAPGGWLVVSVLGALPDRLSQALAGLKLARIGTYAWTTTETEARLRGVGFEQIETFFHNSQTAIIVGRKAGASEKLSHDARPDIWMSGSGRSDLP